MRDPGLRMTPILLPATNRKTIIALKTNLLYDLITALNFEIEIPIGNKFSIAVEDVFPWWSWGPHDRKYCFQMWEMGIEPRWWFRRTDEREVLTGQFFGVYGMSAKYDFQWNIKALPRRILVDGNHLRVRPEDQSPLQLGILCLGRIHIE